MRVLVIGSGAREHALCRALRADPAVDGLLCAPGNPGTAELAETAPLDVADPAAVRDLARSSRADYVLIGPEVPLVHGAADALRAAGIETFGPSAAAARIEGSKSFAKDVMAAAGVPTAAGVVVSGPGEAEAALDRFGAPYVVKADGLAAGKGVLVTRDRAEALAAARGGAPVIVERYLAGPEVSLFCVVTEDGAVLALPAAQDAKRVGDGDTGPNTGGMGAYAPLDWAPPGLSGEVVDTIVAPTLAELRRRGTPFSGLLYAGLVLTADGPAVIEFNARFGDPETQSVLALLDTPLTAVLRGAAEPRFRPGAAVTVVLAAHGYPGQPRAGDPITGLDEVQPPATVLHAGTARGPDGRLVTAGGRVLSVTATGTDLETARECAYGAARRIRFAGAHYRSDIARTAREKGTP